MNSPTCVALYGLTSKNLHLWSTEERKSSTSHILRRLFHIIVGFGMRTLVPSVQRSWPSWSRRLSPGCCVIIATTSPASSQMSLAWPISLTVMEAVTIYRRLTYACGRTAVKVRDADCIFYCFFPSNHLISFRDLASVYLLASHLVYPISLAFIVS